LIASWAVVIVDPAHTSDIATATVRISGNGKVCLFMFMSRRIIPHPSQAGHCTSCTSCTSGTSGHQARSHQARPSGAELRDLPPASILRLVTITLELPEDIARQLSTAWRDLSRAAMEGLALEAYRARKLNSDQMRRLLGFETRFELDGFLKQHGVWLEYSVDDLGRDRETHKRLGL
jgi:hypothetical protein